MPLKPSQAVDVEYGIEGFAAILRRILRRRGRAVYTSARIRQRDGRGFIAELSYKDDAGRWRKKSKTLNAKRKRDAQRELEAWRAEMEEAARREGGSAPGVTVADYVAGYIDARATKIEASSATGYRTLLRNSIAPYIGGTSIGDLTAEEVEGWVSALCRERSAHTAAKALVLLRAALTRAVERGAIPADPTRTVEKPRARKARPNSLAARERGRVAAYVDIDPADPVSVAVRLALYAGMREGEICGLRWARVDIPGGALTVCESLGRASARDVERAASGSARSDFTEVYSGVYLKRPKNAGSERTVSYPRSVARALKARRAAMAAGCMAAGIPFDESMFVCGSIDGKPMHPHGLWKRWAAIVSALDLVGTEGRPPTFHDLRHTYATTAIASGVDVKTVSNQMGHANAAMTLNTYASVDPDAAKRAAEAMERALAADARATAPAEVLEIEGTGTDGR